MNCDFSNFVCPTCGFDVNKLKGLPEALDRRTIRRNCLPISSTTLPAGLRVGPGTALQGLLKRRFGVVFESNCGCRAMVDRMNRWGPSSCREHLDEIVEALQSEFARRREKQLLPRKLALIPFSRVIARVLVKRACKLAESRSQPSLF
jgi:hypothetical protein